MREERETVGTLIRRARQDRGLTQRQLAERLHVTDKSVSKWERDVCRPDVALLEPLAEALGLGVLQLVTGQAAPEAEDAARRLADTSVKEIRRKARRVSARWLAVLGAALVLAVWALASMGYRFTAEAAARQGLFSGRETAQVLLEQPMGGYQLFLFSDGDSGTYRTTLTERWGPLWRPLGVEVRAETTGQAMEGLGGLTLNDDWGCTLFRCDDPAVETVEVYLTSDRKNTVTRKVETGEVQLLVWTADLNREIWPDEEGVEGQRTISFTPTAVALDGAGNVLWHLDMPMVKYRIYTNLYRWWPGPEGEWPGLEEALAQQEASSGPF